MSSMVSGKIILAELPIGNGLTKLRPALVIKVIPPFNDLLVCGISTQLHQEVKGFDEVILKTNNDFAASGLMQTSLIRLGYLAVIPTTIVSGAIGSISDNRLTSLKNKLANFILAT